MNSIFLRMSIITEARSSGAKEEIRDSVRTVIKAEENNEEMINSGSEKNTHFEFRFDEGGDEVYVYIERLEHDNGLEVMFWVDESYFNGVDSDRPSIEEGGEELSEFVEIILDYIVDELEGNHSIRPLYKIDAPPSIVFSDSFYL